MDCKDRIETEDCCQASYCFCGWYHDVLLLFIRCGEFDSLVDKRRASNVM